MKFSVIITAGGTSSRFGNTNKLLEQINGKEIIRYTIDAFVEAGIEDIVVCTNSSYRLLSYILAELPVHVIEGGATRQESVYNGLQAVDCDYVLIHDGARPMISPEIIKKTMAEVVEKKAVSVMTKTVDTIKKVDENGKILTTIDRSQLYNTQTPQAFELSLIKEVHEKYKGQSFTDDAGMVEEFGKDVYIVEGDYRNIKVTTKSDLALAEVYLNE
jgi:2-C-methyl-D-erythritol 4-phosphate cytidylyltransferase